MTYHDNKGIVWVKNGADKRKVFDNAELAEMMTDCGSFAPDEAAVRDATVNDLDTRLRHSDTGLDTDHDTFAEDHDTQLRHSDTDLDTDHDTFAEDHDTIHSYHDTKRVPLTNKQKDIVNFCSVPRTSREILERAGVVYHTKNIAKYITSLVAAGYLQMTNPENPTASNQKYKKVTTK